VQGLSTSLPEHIQRKLLETIPGLEKAQLMRARNPCTLLRFRLFG